MPRLRVRTKSHVLTAGDGCLLERHGSAHQGLLRGCAGDLARQGYAVVLCPYEGAATEWGRQLDLHGSGPLARGCEGCPRQDSNLRFYLRRVALYPLSYGGSGPYEATSCAHDHPRGRL